jgi:hypothetical protein
MLFPFLSPLSGEGKGMFKYFYSLLIYDFVLNILEEIIKDEAIQEFGLEPRY